MIEKIRSPISRRKVTLHSVIGFTGRSHWTRAVRLALFFCVLYIGADFGLNRFAFSDGWTILWPLNGVTIGLLLMRRRTDWPAILIGVALGTGLGEHFDGNHNHVVLQRLISLGEVLISALVLPRFVTLVQWMRERHIYSRFLAALLLGPGISGLAAAMLFHFANGRSFWISFNDWATADALGIAATMPLALSLGSPEMRGLLGRRLLPRTLGVLVLAIAITGLTFSVSRYPLLFLLYPVLLLVDSLLGFAGSAIALFAVCILSVYLTTHGYGPFAHWAADLFVPANVAQQIYLGFHLVALFPASIFFLERRRMTDELKATNARLTTLASIDSLTGIANRRTLDERFSQEWKRSIRVQSPLAMLMIDLDHFKEFNDQYGHPAGDRCLQAVAGLLTSQIRRPEDVLARFGGEEFAILLPHTSLEGARELADKLRLAVMQLGIDHTGSIRGCVTVSIGCAALTPVMGEDMYELLQLSDTALYQAKASGRNCVESRTRPPSS